MIAWYAAATSLRSANRADAEFFDPRAERVHLALREQGALPLGVWVSSALRGVAPEYSDEGSVRVVKTANVRRFSLAGRPDQYVSADFARANPRASIPQAALVVTATGVGSAGRTFVKLDDEPMIADAHVTILPTGDVELAAFLCAYLQSPIGRQQLLRCRRGSSRQIEIYPQDIASVLVPQIAEAERASIATRWLAAVRAVAASATAVSRAEARIANLVGEDRLFVTGHGDRMWAQQVSGLQFEGRIDPEFAAPSIRRLRQRLLAAGGIALSELVTTARKGFQPQRYTEGGEVYVLKSKDVHYPDFDLSSCQRATDDDWPYYLKGGEVLVNVTGQGTLGRSTVVPTQAAQKLSLIPSVDVYALEVDRSLVLPEYIALFLNCPFGRRLTEALQTGSSGQQHLYPAHFSRIPIPIPRSESGAPDLAWQRETVRIAETRNAALRAAQQAGAELDAMFVERLGVPVDLAIVPF